MTNQAKPIIQVFQDAVLDRTPFWFMRQAGRYLPEYRALRKEAGGFLDMAYNPDFATEVTLQPIRRFGMDAAILFSDILVIPHALGQDLSFQAGEGPVLPPIRDEAGLKVLSDEKLLENLNPVFQAIKNIRAALEVEHPNVALIGFAGAPWTVATYMVEGGGSKTFAEVKGWAYGRSPGFSRLMDILVDATSQYLIAQVEAGAEVLQIFDTWSSALDKRGFHDWVIAPTAEIVRRVREKCPETPIIGFPKGAGHLIGDYVRKTDVDGVGVDYATDLESVLKAVPENIVIQGNLDPIRLISGGEDMLAEARKILAVMKGRKHIFNLGHGFQPETPVEHVEALVALLKGGV